MRRVLLVSVLLGVAALAGCSWFFRTTELPVAVISATPTAGPVPLTVNFDGSASTTGEGTRLISYIWDFGDGSPTIDAITVSHTYMLQGEYTASLIVRDDQHRSAMAFVTIRASNSPPIIESIIFTGAISGPGTKFYGGETITFECVASDWDGYIVDIFWDFGDGSYGRGTTVMHSYRYPPCGREPRSEFYYVTVVVTDNAGNTTRRSQLLEVVATCG